MKSQSKIFVAAIACLWGAGCAVGPDYIRPAAPAATGHYTRGADPVATVPAGDVVQRFKPGAEVPADWWTLFKSPKLDAVMTEALARNPGLESAQASLRASQFNRQSGYGIFWPQVGADFSPSRQRYSPERTGLQGAPSIFNLFSLSGTVNYAVDLFGGERRALEGLGAAVDQQRATVNATYLALTTNVVDTLVARAAYQAEIAATERVIQFEAEQERLATVQVNAGNGSYAALLSVRSQLAAAEALIPPLRQKLSQTEDLLATLAGHLPSEWEEPDLSLTDLTLPADLPVSLPSAIVGQRPDILAAEAALHAASANIGVATAALLPSLNLTGAYGGNSNTMGSLGAENARFWNLGAEVTAPLFQGGALWFKRKAAVETYNQTQADYRQAVLGAFAQVADTLRALEHDAEALQAQDKALKAADDALQLVQANYHAGLSSMSDLLIADTQFEQASIQELQARAVRYQDTVALFAALGGGWWRAPQVAAAAAK
jgi:NodT family efflux transporter outer membrane factor (OMF) lipoprotein